MPLYRCSFPGTLPAGDIFQFSLMVTGAENIEGAATAADAALTGLMTTAAFMWTPLTTFNPPQIAEVSAAVNFPTIQVASGSVSLPGEATTDFAHPPQCAIVCSLRTALAGRRFRGRFFLPSPANNVTVQGGTLDPTRMADFALGLSDFFAGFTGFNFNPVVGHRDLGTTTVCTHADVGTVIDTQRRRRDAVPETRYAVAIAEI